MNDINSVSNLVISTAVLFDVRCASCVSVIERRFNKEQAIDVNVNFVTKKVRFNYDGNLWDEVKIKKIMRRLGYKIANFVTEVNS